MHAAAALGYRVHTDCTWL